MAGSHAWFALVSLSFALCCLPSSPACTPQGLVQQLQGTRIDYLITMCCEAEVSLVMVTVAAVVVVVAAAAAAAAAVVVMVVMAVVIVVVI